MNEQAEIEKLRAELFAYKQECECWRAGDGMGEFIGSMRDVEAPKPHDPNRPYSDEALWSWEIVGCKQLTDETIAAHAKPSPEVAP